MTEEIKKIGRDDPELIWGAGLHGAITSLSKYSSADRDFLFRPTFPDEPILKQLVNGELDHCCIGTIDSFNRSTAVSYYELITRFVQIDLTVHLEPGIFEVAFVLWSNRAEFYIRLMPETPKEETHNDRARPAT